LVIAAWMYSLPVVRDRGVGERIGDRAGDPAGFLQRRVDAGGNVADADRDRIRFPALRLPGVELLDEFDSFGRAEGKPVGVRRQSDDFA